MRDVEVSTREGWERRMSGWLLRRFRKQKREAGCFPRLVARGVVPQRCSQIGVESLSEVEPTSVRGSLSSDDQRLPCSAFFCAWSALMF